MQNISQRSGSQSPDYTVLKATDDSCILFETTGSQNDSVDHEYETFRNHTPTVSLGRFHDPEAFETHINNPHSFEKLLAKLSALEPRHSPAESEESTTDVVRQISADQSVILITSAQLDQPPAD